MRLLVGVLSGSLSTRIRKLMVLLIAAVLATTVLAVDARAVPLATGTVIDDFEDGLPFSAAIPNGEPLGFYTIQGDGSVAIQTVETPPAPIIPEIGTSNNVMQIDVDVASFAGYTHAFEDPAVTAWVAQDWSTSEGIRFWMHGNGSGTQMFIDLLDNRNAGSTTDDAERFTAVFVDDFSGWQLMELPFNAFVRKEIGNGAPNDGLGLFEMHGYTLGTLGTGGPQTFYFDEVGLYGVAELPDPGGEPYAVIHYQRTDGDYGDHTTGDFNDYWGLHLWGDLDPSEATDWTNQKPFLGEDEYGRFAWVKLTPDASNVRFIVHRGDTKDGTDADRSFDPSVTPEIWLRQDDATTYTSQADAQGYVTIRYHRDDGDYGTPSADYTTHWGLHLWGDAIDPSEGTEWTSPKPPSGIDDYGAYWLVPIADSSLPVNFIIHRGDTKDSGPDESFIPSETATAWKQSGDEKIYPSRGAAEGYATIHYHRDDGDYGDPSSPDYNDFWGMQTWGGASDPGWTTPRKPVGFDTFGAVFEIPLFDDAADLSYILHRGDTKDPDPDQNVAFSEWGYEVWQLSGENPSGPTEPHYVLPIRGGALDTNRPPVADANGPYSGAEGSLVTLDGSGSLDPDGDALTYDWDLDNDGEYDDATGVTTSWMYSDGPATETVGLRVTDVYGEADFATAIVTVSNVAPTATFGNDGPVDEGTGFTLGLTAPSDPSSADTAAGFLYSFDCGDGSGYGASGAAATATCPTDDNALRSVKGRVQDKDGGVTEYTDSVTVRNVSPTLGPITVVPTLIMVGGSVNASAACTDLSTADTHTADWDWDDGDTSSAATPCDGPTSVTGGHTYTAAGVHTVGLAVTDDDGGTATEIFQYVIVYDASAGFVTGGGWIDSPAGAYKDDPSLTGKATFGFVSKYKKGASVPTGNTEFQFQAGDLHFHSFSYDWLVVTGSSFAKFKGEGTINGGGTYKFQIWAGDSVQDTFRIKIWSEDGLGGETIVYDNGMNQGIGAGSIVIHTNKK